MKCKNCGSEIREAAFVCMHCGVRTDDTSPKDESAPPITCAYCGSKIDPRAYLCVNCGRSTKKVRVMHDKPVYIPGVVFACLGIFWSLVQSNFNLIVAAILIVVGMSLSIRKSEKWSVIFNVLAMVVCLAVCVFEMSFIAVRL